MSMYKFVKGSRLFMQAKRDTNDFDNIHDTFNPTEDDRTRGGYLTSSRSRRGHEGRDWSDNYDDEATKYFFEGGMSFAWVSSGGS